MQLVVEKSDVMTDEHAFAFGPVLLMSNCIPHSRQDRLKTGKK